MRVQVSRIQVEQVTICYDPLYTLRFWIITQVLPCVRALTLLFPLVEKHPCARNRISLCCLHEIANTRHHGDLQFQRHHSDPHFYFFVVCLFFAPLKNFSLIWRRHHNRRRATNFYLYSALMAVEHWGFLNLSHLMWQGPTFHNFHLWGAVTLTPIAKRLAVDLSLPVLTT